MKLAWAAEFDRIDEAFAFEKRLQGWSRAKRIAVIEGRYADLPDLARRRSRSTFVNWEAKHPPEDSLADE